MDPEVTIPDKTGVVSETLLLGNGCGGGVGGRGALAVAVDSARKLATLECTPVLAAAARDWATWLNGSVGSTAPPLSTTLSACAWAYRAALAYCCKALKPPSRRARNACSRT